MKKIGSLVAFEAKRMLPAGTTAIYAAIYLISFIICAVLFKLYGSAYTVLTVGNAQSFPIQLLQSSYLFTGIFLAIYIAQITVQERSQGTVKLVLLRPVSRAEYFISRVISIFLFSLLLTLIMIISGYTVGMVFFGWGDRMVFRALVSGGIQGVFQTLLSGLFFTVSYFPFGLLALLVSQFTGKLLESAVIMGLILMAGQYFELLPSIKQFTVSHQMLFFHIDIFEQTLAYNITNTLVVLVYCLIFIIAGFLVFRKKDLTV